MSNISSSYVNTSSINETSGVVDNSNVKQIDGDTIQSEVDMPNASAVLANSKKKKIFEQSKISQKIQDSNRLIKETVQNKKEDQNNQKNKDNKKESFESINLDKLKKDIKFESNVSSIYTNALNFAKDPFGAYGALDTIAQNSNNETLKNKINKAMDIITENHSLVLASGINIAPVVKKYSKIAKPYQLRELYEKVILKKSDYLSTLHEVSMKFNDKESQKEAFNFLLEASGIDLKNRNIDPLRSMTVLNSVKKTRALLSLKSEFESKKNFLEQAIKNLKSGDKPPSISQVYNIFISSISRPSISSSQIETLINSISPEKNAFISAAISRLMLSVARNISEEFFSSGLSKSSNASQQKKLVFIRSLQESLLSLSEKERELAYNQIDKKLNSNFKNEQI